MNIKNNKRHQDTINTIEQVFIALLQENDLSKIKVSTLCTRAQISRGTFYANYVDIYDLADKILLQLQNEVHALLIRDNKLQFSMAEFLSLFQHIRDNQALYTVYFKLTRNDSTEADMATLYQLSNISMSHMDFHIAFFEAGFNALVKKWLATGCAISPEEMIEILAVEYHGRVAQG
jgi:AcrR family transcriptional regulator